VGNSKTILVTGGCKSGKSSHALRLAESAASENRVFVATCVPQDDEMHLRVQKHQKERGAGWSTVECPVLIPDAIRGHGKSAQVMVIDCLTLWLSNIYLEFNNMDRTLDQVSQLANVLKKDHCPVILVTNEVGAGIVPENRLARTYRDIVGVANQRIASVADRVDWVVSGIPVTIKETTCPIKII
jgi:adenosylcobinamide kinase/adenosylcobinamide-phosphate guanylyltransferase